MPERQLQDMNNSRFTVFKFTGSGMAWYVVSLPSCSLTACVLISLFFYFDQITRTECGVPNFLPSISAAVGDMTPQRYIWRIGIALHSAPRLLMAVSYYNYYQNFEVKHKRLYVILTAVNTLLNLTENLCLVGLTFVSSTENFLIHEVSFGGFILFSQLYMVLTLVLYKWAHSKNGLDHTARQSYKWKVFLAVLNITVLFIALYVYWRHNTYCEPGMYSIFAILEYLVVASNIMFHATFFRDMKDIKLELSATILSQHKVQQKNKLQ